MKKSMRLLAMIIAVTMVILAFAGCAQSQPASPSPAPAANAEAPAKAEPAAPPAGEKITLRMDQFSGNGDNEAVLKNMIAEFNKLYPDVTVELQSFGYDDYFTQLQSKVVGGTAADVFELNFENFVAYASEDVLADIGDMIGDTSGFNATALDAFKYGGKQYGVPDSFSNVVLIYNKELFDKAEVPYPTNDWKWADMMAAGEKIRALDQDTFGLFRPVSFHEFYKAAKQNGSSLMNDDMTAFTVNTPQNVEALETMVSWQNGSNIMPTAAQMGGMGDWDLFKSGRLGMIVTGIWAFGDFKENITFQWDVAVEPGNTNKATHFFSNAYVVNKECKNPETAAALVAFLAGSKEAASLRVAASWELPPVTYTDVLDSYLKITPPDSKQAVFDSLNYLVTPPVVEQQSEMQDIISRHLESVVSGAASAKDALDACQKELEDKIKL